jgi:hypothetical protein
MLVDGDPELLATRAVNAADGSGGHGPSASPMFTRPVLPVDAHASVPWQERGSSRRVHSAAVRLD